MTLSDQKYSTSVTEAKTAPNKLQWEEAIKTEMKSLQVCELVDPPPNQEVICSKWIFKFKVNTDGVVE